MKKKGRRKKLAGEEKALRLFYTVCAVVTGIVLLGLGVSVAGRFSAENLDGSFPQLIFLEDIVQKKR